MIPKIIHYCWFGGGPKTEKITWCLDTWRKFLPGYDIVEWNEDVFDISTCDYVSEAYKAKKWAFVSDYVRAYALFTRGGIYLDTDVEIRNSLDPFLIHGAFSGFESQGFSFTALWGAEKTHHWPEKVLETYKTKKFTSETNTVAMTDLLERVYGFNPLKDTLQVFNDDIYIYPSSYFCLDIPNYAVHHFEGSWLDSKHEHHYKDYILQKYFQDQFLANQTSFNSLLHTLQDKFNVSTFELMLIVLRRFAGKIIPIR